MKAKRLATQCGEQSKGGAQLTPVLCPCRTGNQERGGSEFELLTQDEVALRLKVTVRTVIRLQRDGVLPFILLGKAVRFYWPAVVSHLISNFTVTKCVPHGPVAASSAIGPVAAPRAI